MLEGLESRTVLSTLHAHAPAVEAAAIGHAQPEHDEHRILSEHQSARITIGGTVSLPVAVSGNLTLNNFSVNSSNQLIATGSLNVNGTAVPVNFNANVTQGTNGASMTLTPTDTSLNIAGLGTVNLGTQTPINISASSSLGTLLGSVVQTAGGITNLGSIATGLNAGLNANTNSAGSVSVNGTASTPVGVQRFIDQNGQLMAQVLIKGNTQATLPLNAAGIASGTLSFSTGTSASGAISLGNTGVQLQTGQSISLPINGNFGRAAQAGNLIRRLETIATFSPRLERLLTNELNRLVTPSTGQAAQSTSLIGGTVSLPVAVSGNLTLSNFSVNSSNQLTATGSLNVNGTAVPVNFNAAVTQTTTGTALALTPTNSSLNIAGLGTVNLGTQTALNVTATSPLGTLLGSVVQTAGGTTNLGAIATGLDAGLNANTNSAGTVSLSGTANTAVSVQRFGIQNGQLTAQVLINGNTQATLPVSTSPIVNGSLSLRTGTSAGGAISLGNTGVTLQSGQSINVSINEIPGPGNLVLNLFHQLGDRPRLLFRVVGQLNERLVLGARLFD